MISPSDPFAHALFPSFCWKPFKVCILPLPDEKVCICSVNAAKAKGGMLDERIEGAVESLLGIVKVWSCAPPPPPPASRLPPPSLHPPLV